MPLNWRVWCVGVCLPMCGLLRILVDVLCWCVRPSNVRSRSGQPCSLCRAVDLCVLRPARRIHIRLRGRVLHNSPPPASVRSALAPTVTALGTSGRVRRGARWLGLSPAPCAAAPVVFAAIRAAMLRRRDTVSSPCDVSHRASDEPRRCMSLSSALAPSSLASSSIRRVFLRSICARRHLVSELNPVRGSFAALIFAII